MAKVWAKAFYNSAKWQRVRDYVIAREHGLCSKCGRPGYIVHHKRELTPANVKDPSVTLNPGNHTYLCKTCHDDIHGVGKHKDKEERYHINSKGEVIFN